MESEGDTRPVAEPATVEPPAAPAMLRSPARLVCARARIEWAVEGLVLTAILVGALLVARTTSHVSSHWVVPAVVVIAVFFAMVAIVRPTVRYRIHRWEVTDDAVYTQRGFLTIEQRIAPISRIQTVDTERGVLSRVFGLSTVTVTTASAKGELRIEGLDRSTAERIVADLTAMTAASAGDAT